MAATGTYAKHRPNSVVAQFPDCLLAFEIPGDATFADLAERIATFEERMDEMPIAVAVRPAA
ncbi:MAG TPA: hypothetical protein VID77_07075 [Stellaceae bacterium]|jgi:hypothetical protein